MLIQKKENIPLPPNVEDADDESWHFEDVEQKEGFDPKTGDFVNEIIGTESEYNDATYVTENISDDE